MKTVRILLPLLLVLLIAGAAWGQSRAVFTEVNGKVEVRAAAGGPWTDAEPGMEVSNNTMIATGFNASAALRMGDSTVRVQQLTRMEFEGILEQEGAVETRLNLNVGRMSAQVRSSDGRAQNFQVRSPISTAAVRGTDFEYDGEQVVVTQGQVDIVNNQTNQSQPVQAGQQSTTSGSEPPSQPAREAVAAAVTSTAPLGSGSSEDREAPPPAVAGRPDTAAPPPPRATRGSAIIQVQ